MRIQFLSIINPEKNNFVYDSDSWDNAPVSPKFLVHYKRDHNDSWHFPIALPTNLAGEYMLSLANEMLKNDELTKSVRYEFTSGPIISDINFAHKVVYKSGKKTTYYSASLQRTSAVRSKQYDKRWREVTEEMDGSPESIMNILLGGYWRDGISCYAYAYAIRKWMLADRKLYRKYSMSLPAQYLKWTDDYNEAHAIQCGWDAVITALEIFEAKKNFKHITEQYNQYAMMVTLER